MVQLGRDDKAESLRHLEYEIAMLVAAVRMMHQHDLQEKNTQRPPGYFWSNDKAVAYLVALESALVHARLLDDFFKPATGNLPSHSHKKADRFAADYCQQWNGMRLLTDDQHDRIDKQLSHFSTVRAARHEHPIGAFANEAVAALAELARQAEPKWRPQLETILARARAEQNRHCDAWDALS